MNRKVCSVVAILVMVVTLGCDSDSSSKTDDPAVNVHIPLGLSTYVDDVVAYTPAQKGTARNKTRSMDNPNDVFMEKLFGAEGLDTIVGQIGQMDEIIEDLNSKISSDNTSEVPNASVQAISDDTTLTLPFFTDNDVFTELSLPEMDLQYIVRLGDADSVEAYFGAYRLDDDEEEVLLIKGFLYPELMGEDGVDAYAMFYGKRTANEITLINASVAVDKDGSKTKAVMSFIHIDKTDSTFRFANYGNQTNGSDGGAAFAIGQYDGHFLFRTAMMSGSSELKLVEVVALYEITDADELPQSGENYRIYNQDMDYKIDNSTFVSEFNSTHLSEGVPGVNGFVKGEPINRPESLTDTQWTTMIAYLSKMVDPGDTNKLIAPEADSISADQISELFQD